MDYVGNKAASSRSEFVRLCDTEKEEGEGKDENPFISILDGLDEQQEELLEAALAARKEAGDGSICSNEEEEEDFSKSEAEDSDSDQPESAEEEVENSASGELFLYVSLSILSF